jgi:uncharacterized protein YcfL
MSKMILLLPLLLAACATEKQVAVKAPEIELVMDKQMQPMTRNEVIMAINECEKNGTRAVVINSRRKINGYSAEVVVDVTCAPRYY